MKRIIDCNQVPMFDGRHMAKHQQFGIIEFRPENVSYYQVDSSRKLIWERNFLEKQGVKMANLNIALSMIENPELIPERFKAKNEKSDTDYFYFLGSVINGCLSDEYVFYFHWNLKDNHLDYGERNSETFGDKTDFIVIIK